MAQGYLARGGAMIPENPYKNAPMPFPYWVWQEGFDAAVKWLWRRCIEHEHPNIEGCLRVRCPECIAELERKVKE